MKTKIFATAVVLAILLTNTYNTSYAGKPNLIARAHRQFYSSTSTRNGDTTGSTPDIDGDHSSIAPQRMMDDSHSDVPNSSTTTLNSGQDKKEEKTLTSHIFHLDNNTITKLPTTENLCASQDMTDDQQ